MGTIAGAVALAVVMGFSGTANAQVIYDAGIDLRIAETAGVGEPALPVNGVWTYGTSDVADAGAAFTAFPGSWHNDALPAGACSTQFEGWQETPDDAGDLVPLVAVNTSGVPQSSDCFGIDSFAADTFWVHPNIDSSPLEYVVVRWTAPTFGNIDITADWVAKHTGGVSTHVRMNGVMLGADGDTSGGTVNYVQNGVAVAAGDTIDFVTGNHTDNYFADSTEFNAIIAFSVFQKEITSGPCVSDPSVTCESDDLGLGSFVEVVGGIANGSFEDDACGANFCTLNGPGGLTGWTIGGAGIDLITTFWTDHAEGNQSLDMSALNAGSVTQTLTGLTPGRNYEVTFSLAGNFAGGGNIKDLRVSVDTGSLPTDYQFDTNIDCGGACSAANMGWTSKTYAFTANDADTDLTFTSLTATNGGPALDDVKLFEEELDEIAVAVLAPATSSIHYDFKITANTEGLTDPVVYDTVPAEWTITEIDKSPAGPDDEEGNWDANFGDFDAGVGCGGSNVVGDVTVSRGGNSKKNNCSSATHIVWELEPDQMDMIRVDLQSRGPKKNGKFKPTFCGALYLNDGAELKDGGELIATSNRLVVASVFDLSNSSFPADGDPEPDGMVDPTGAGDEDQDGASDIDEVRNLGTNPCDDDTDGDGVLDGADLCPLLGGTVDQDGCPV